MRNRTDIVGSLLLIAIGVGVVIESLRLKLGTPLTPLPGFFPFIGGSLLIGLSIILLVQGLLPRDRSTRQPWKAAGDLGKPAALIASLGVYTAALSSLGYLLPTTLLVAVMLRILGVTSWKILILASLGLSAGAYLLFGRVLGIDLPAGILPFLP
jgi:putative tricarboxylic transport membrane protein